MRENKFETLKRKKIRKLLLLRINDELKQISKTKSNIMINSKTIQELNQVYNQNNIILYEKSRIYSNYMRTEETIISKNMSPINVTKTLNKSQSKKQFKTKIKLEPKISQFGIPSMDDDSASPIKNFFPKKIELARNKFLKNKPKLRNNRSIVLPPEKHSDTDKEIREKKILKSTKLGNGDLHLHKLIEKITTIKNNESTEALIIENIKKLRNYCYQLRKPKKRAKRMSLYKNNSFRKKSRDKEKKVEIDEHIRKRNTKIDEHPVKESFFSIQQKMEQNYKNKENNRNEKSLSLSSPKFCKLKKKSTSIAAKFSHNYKISMNPRPLNKNKNYSTLKNKDRLKKLQTLNEEDIETKNTKSHKKKNRKTKTEEKYLDENVPYLNKIPKEIMRYTINDIKMKFDAYNNDDNDKSKPKYNKIKNLKKKINKNMSIQIMNNKKNENVLKYFNNLNIKKDKIELHEFLNKSSQKIKKLEQTKRENEKKNEENEEIIKLKKLSIILDSRKNSKKKIFDSTETGVYRYSNFSNYNSNKMNTSNQITNDSNHNKSFMKKSKRGKI